MQRMTEEIDGIDDVFTYDTDLFAEAMKLSRPELYELAKGTNRRGISTLRKYDLAVIVADAETYQRDEQRRAAEADEQFEAYVTEKAPLTAERIFGTAPDALTQPMRARAELIEEAHAEALDIDARQQEENERAAARDYAPSVDSAPEFSPEFLKQQAENEQAYGRIKAREEAARVDTLIEQLDGRPAEPVAERPRKLDTWLQQGMILVSPDTSAQYRFLRWDKGGAVVLNLNTRMEFAVPQPEIVENWRYLPQASAEGVAQAVEARRLSIGDRVTHNRTGALGTVNLAADGVAHVTPDDPRAGVWRGLFSDFTRVSGPWHRTHVRHLLSGEIYTLLGYNTETSVAHGFWLQRADGTAKRVKPWVLFADYTACCEHGNGPRETCQGCGTEDEHGNQIEPQRIVLEAALLRRVADADDARSAAEEKTTAVLGDVEQLAAYWERQSTREGFVPRAPWVALRCIVKEHGA